jgi:transposase InsO family protein
LLDDFSRYVLAWKLCTTMSATDVSDTLQIALQTSGLNRVKVLHQPRLLSDNGPSYLSSDLANWLDHNGIQRRLFLLRATRPSWAPQGSRSSSLPLRLAECCRSAPASRRLLNQSTHSSVAYSTASNDRHGVKSDTQSLFGLSAANCLFTLSSGHGVAWSVVAKLLGAALQRSNVAAPVAR